MKENEKTGPPRWAERFLKWYCRPDLLEDLQGDLNEFFDRNVKTKGTKKARWIYILDVLKFFRLYTIRKPKLKNPMPQQYMLRSYIKTSGRSILRHKLFAGINIIGLAISMCVGLLVISFLSDLYAYDNFHEKKARTYRITTHDAGDGREPINLASSSYGAGKKIQQSVPGIEKITFLQRGFGGDAKVEETTIAVSGLWASESFFDVFSFPLIKGNPATALQKPNSIVLTEKAAKKVFGNTDVVGKMIKFDTSNYIVTGVAKDIPKLSHMNFEALGSYATIENRPGASGDGDIMSWENIYSNYTYLVLPEKANRATVQASIDKLAKTENANLQKRNIQIELESLQQIVVDGNLGNEIGPTINKITIYFLAGLALVVIISACFNYTNLSIARSLTRSREVGIRKVIGAQKSHVRWQFITESILVSLLSLVLAFFLFLVLRRQFLNLHSFVQSLVTLELTPRLILYFVAFALLTGLIAGLLPAFFYARITAIQVLNNVSSLKVFRHVNLRKSFIVIQYTFSLVFIATTVIGYNQYKSFIAHDLGFSTKNVLNIRMQGNRTGLFQKEIAEIPGVKEISKSLMISSLGSIYGTQMKYNDPMDSSGVQLNFIDEHYLPVHDYKILAGRNFTTRPVDGQETEVLVNETLVKRFSIGKGDLQKAIGEIVNIDNKKLAIAGVLKDFHYGTMDHKIEPVMFRYDGSENAGNLNVKIETPNIAATMAAINDAWKKIDNVHPIDARFYDEQIEEAYSMFSVIIRVIGFFSFLAVVIASMGLFGMVVYTTEKRLKEISIRKVMGANETSLIYLMSKSFFLLLLLSAVIALPATWLLFDKVVLVKFAYHQPLTLGEQLISFGIVAIIACSMIGFQTLKVARSNPANVLRKE